MKHILGSWAAAKPKQSLPSERKMITILWVTLKKKRNSANINTFPTRFLSVTGSRS